MKSHHIPNFTIKIQLPPVALRNKTINKTLKRKENDERSENSFLENFIYLF